MAREQIKDGSFNTFKQRQGDGNRHNEITPSSSSRPLRDIPNLSEFSSLGEISRVYQNINKLIGKQPIFGYPSGSKGDQVNSTLSDDLSSNPYSEPGVEFVNYNQQEMINKVADHELATAIQILNSGGWNGYISGKSVVGEDPDISINDTIDQSLLKEDTYSNLKDLLPQMPQNIGTQHIPEKIEAGYAISSKVDTSSRQLKSNEDPYKILDEIRDINAKIASNNVIMENTVSLIEKNIETMINNKRISESITTNAKSLEDDKILKKMQGPSLEKLGDEIKDLNKILNKDKKPKSETIEAFTALKSDLEALFLQKTSSSDFADSRAKVIELGRAMLTKWNSGVFTKVTKNRLVAIGINFDA